MSTSARRSSQPWAHHHALVLGLLFLLSVNAVLAGSIVKYLPGYEGELPFTLETGYISVDDSELFYYFIESQGNPREDPIFLWLTGGPGCSGFNGLIYEIGPMEFDISNYAGGVPKLLPYAYAWTKTASIIFLDAPVGTGFSYSTNSANWSSSDSDSAYQSYEFLLKFMAEHPQYLQVPLFVGGDSYSGKTVPLVVKHILDGIKDDVKPYLNLKGFLIGSPRTDSVIDVNSKIKFAHRMALISDELYETAKVKCNGNYVDVDPSNTGCVTALASINACVQDLFKNNILEPSCKFASPKPDGDEQALSDRRSLAQISSINSDFVLSPPQITELWCRNFNYVLSYIWANEESVQDALHVRKGTVKYWQRCNQTLSYTKDIKSVVSVHQFLKDKALEVLVECADHDMVVPFVGTVEWIKSLNLTLDSPWRPWYTDGEVAGYTERYTNDGYRMTYTIIKGTGHTAPEYQRRRCYMMFDRWIHYYPL